MTKLIQTQGIGTPPLNDRGYEVTLQSRWIHRGLENGDHDCNQFTERELIQRGSQPRTVTSVSFQNDLFCYLDTLMSLSERFLKKKPGPSFGRSDLPTIKSSKKLNSMARGTSHGRKIRLLLALRVNIFTYFAPFFPDQQKPNLCTRCLGPLFLSYGPWVLAE